MLHAGVKFQFIIIGLPFLCKSLSFIASAVRIELFTARVEYSVDPLTEYSSIRLIPEVARMVENKRVPGSSCKLVVEGSDLCSESK